MERIRVEQHSVGGMLWIVGWLFTIGLLNLNFLRGAAALFIWPADLGYALGPLLMAAAK